MLIFLAKFEARGAYSTGAYKKKRVVEICKICLNHSLISLCIFPGLFVIHQYR